MWCRHKLTICIINSNNHGTRVCYTYYYTNYELKIVIIIYKTLFIHEIAIEILSKGMHVHVYNKIHTCATTCVYNDIYGVSTFVYISMPHRANVSLGHVWVMVSVPVICSTLTYP